MANDTTPNAGEERSNAPPPPPPTPKPGTQADSSETQISDSTIVSNPRTMYRALQRFRPQVAKLLPHGMSVERFCAVVQSCYDRTPSLAECTWGSIRQAIQAAAELGLELGGVSGEAYLVPYNNKREIEVNGRKTTVWVVEAQFIAGYKGYLRLAQESGLFQDEGIFASAIYPDDIFEEPERGPNGVTWRFKENRLGELQTMTIPLKRWDKQQRCVVDAGETQVPLIRGAFAVAQPKGTTARDIVATVPLWRIEQIRLRSKSGSDGPWITDYPEMAAKTAIRALWKRIPKSERMQKLAEYDQEIVLSKGEDGTYHAPAPPQVPTAEPREMRDPAKSKIVSVAEALAKRNAEKAAQEDAPQGA